MLNHVVIAGPVAGIFFPVAKQIQRPVRETVTPAILQMIVWAGANIGSFSQASDAVRMLAGIDLSLRRIRRITEQVGRDRLEERVQQVAQFKDKPLMERITSPANVDSPPLGAIMMDGGRYQRRDHFGEEDYDGSHWKEDKVGIVLQMDSRVHQSDPHPEFPQWLAHADVIAEIASLGAIEQEKDGTCGPSSKLHAGMDSVSDGWDQLTPELLSREVIASSQCGEEFGHHLEYAAWQQGVVDAPRTAFVADGASVNWTIHKQHFSQMTVILDLMHALSYAWKAAKALADTAAYQRYATWIWQGEVVKVIDELTRRLSTSNTPEESTMKDSATEDPVQRAITYYTNHQHRMNDPKYRQQGLPLTSSHIESTIKLINIRMKGSEKFFRQDAGETLLQLRADTLCQSAPLDGFWHRWLSNQTGANTYRKQSA